MFRYYHTTREMSIQIKLFRMFIFFVGRFFVHIVQLARLYFLFEIKSLFPTLIFTAKKILSHMNIIAVKIRLEELVGKYKPFKAVCLITEHFRIVIVFHFHSSFRYGCKFSSLSRLYFKLYDLRSVSSKIMPSLYVTILSIRLTKAFHVS